MTRREQAYEIGKNLDLSEFDIEEALYWWCADHHSGQGSEDYSILSSSPFHPGPIARKPEWLAQMIYDALCVEEGCNHDEQAWGYYCEA